MKEQLSRVRYAPILACVLSMGGVLVGCQSVAEVAPSTRTLPARMTDLGLVNSIKARLVSEVPQRIFVEVVNGNVLLTGEIENESARQRATEIVASFPEVRKVYDYLQISTPLSHSYTLQEQYLKNRIEARLLIDRSVNSRQVTIVVRRGIVYVMGNPDPQTSANVLKILSYRQGVLGVEMLFDQESVSAPVIRKN